MDTDSEGDPDDSGEDLKESTDSERGMTFEEWNRAASAADPLDSYLMEKKEFERTEPPVKAIKFYREERSYYLLNRGDRAVECLQYHLVSRDVNARKSKDAELYELRSFPPRSYVEIGHMDLEGDMRMQVVLQKVVWDDEGGVAEESEKLTLFEHSDGGVVPLEKQELQPAEVEPSLISDKDS